MVHYPMRNGRSIPELVRLVRALHTTDQQYVATAEGRGPGEPGIVPPPQTSDQADERLQQRYECRDWYFCMRET